MAKEGPIGKNLPGGQNPTNGALGSAGANNPVLPGIKGKTQAGGEGGSATKEAATIAKTGVDAAKLGANVTAGNWIGAAKNAYDILKDPEKRKMALAAMGGAVGLLLASPKLRKIVFFVLLGIALISTIIMLLIFGMAGKGKYYGSRTHVEAEQSSIDRFMAYTGDPAALRKLIVEQGDKLITELEDLKKLVQTANLTKEKKDKATKEIDDAIKLVKDMRKYLSGEGTNMAEAAKGDIEKLAALIKQISSTTMLLAFRGNFALPLGGVTCRAPNNRTPHTLKAGGHGLFMVQNNDGGALDYNAPAGMPVYALTDSYVTKVGFHSRWQNYYVRLKSKDGKYEMVYAHITKEVKQGDLVTKCDPDLPLECTPLGHLMKGTMANPHLHFEFWINGKPIKEKEQKKYFCGGLR